MCSTSTETQSCKTSKPKKVGKFDVHTSPIFSCRVTYIVLYENMLHVEVMYHFNEKVDFKISSELIQTSKG